MIELNHAVSATSQYSRKRTQPGIQYVLAGFLALIAGATTLAAIFPLSNIAPTCRALCLQLRSTLHWATQHWQEQPVRPVLFVSYGRELLLRFSSIGEGGACYTAHTLRRLCWKRDFNRLCPRRRPSGTPIRLYSHRRHSALFHHNVNAIITKISNAEIRTTHVTGIVTVQINWVSFFTGIAPASASVSPERVLADRQKLALLTSLLLFCSFVAALCGFLGFRHLGFTFTLALAGILVVLAAVPVLDDLRLSREKVTSTAAK